MGCLKYRYNMNSEKVLYSVVKGTVLVICCSPLHRESTSIFGPLRIRRFFLNLAVWRNGRPGCLPHRLCWFEWWCGWCPRTYWPVLWSVCHYPPTTESCDIALFRWAVKPGLWWLISCVVLQLLTENVHIAHLRCNTVWFENIKFCLVKKKKGVFEQTSRVLWTIFCPVRISCS